MLDAFVEGSNDLCFGDAEPSRWRNVAGAVPADWGVLAAHATDRQAKRLADGLGLLVAAAHGELWNLHQDRGSHACAEVGWARGDHTVVVRLGKGEPFHAVDDVEGSLEPVKDVVQDGALLHRHDSQVVFFANPDDEALVSRDLYLADFFYFFYIYICDGRQRWRRWK